MSKDEVGICNLGLGWIGANQISSFDDGTTESILCDANYADARDAVLEEGDWTFATRRYRLTPTTDVPVYAFGKKFLILPEMIHIISVTNGSDNGSWVGDKELDWLKEENYIMATASVIFVKAIVKITDTSRFSPMFTHALAARLAADFAIPLVHSKTLMEDMWQLYDVKIGRAKSSDGRQGRSERKQSTRLTRVRQKGFGQY